MNSDDQQPSQVRYLVVFVTTLTAALLYLDRFCISFAERFIKEELQLTNRQMGWILGTFFLAYALGQVPSGWLGDRFGARRMLTIYVLLWSAFTALSGLAGGFVVLLALRFGFGVAQAGAYPASAGLLSKWMPFSDRGIGSSIVAFGGRVGGTIAPILTAYLIIWGGGQQIVMLGWREVMIVYGCGGILVAFLFWDSARNRPTDHAACNAAEIALIENDRPFETASPHGKVGMVPFLPVLASRSLWLSCVSQFMTNVGWVFLGTWLPRYLDEVHEVPVELRGWMAGIPIFVGWFGMLSGGWLTDRLVGAVGLRWGRGLPMALSRFVAMSAFLVCLLPLSPWIATAMFALVAFATDIGVGATWAFLQDVGGRHVGSILGWTNMCGNFGAFVSPMLLNWAIEQYNWNAAFLTCAACFFISGVAALGIDATIPITPDKANEKPV
jgi:MFS family permease